MSITILEAANKVGELADKIGKPNEPPDFMEKILWAYDEFASELIEVRARCVPGWDEEVIDVVFYLLNALYLMTKAYPHLGETKSGVGDRPFGDLFSRPLMPTSPKGLPIFSEVSWVEAIKVLGKVSNSFKRGHFPAELLTNLLEAIEYFCSWCNKPAGEVFLDKWEKNMKRQEPFGRQLLWHLQPRRWK